MRIMDGREQVLRHKTVRLVKVLWQHRGVDKTTCNVRTQCEPDILSSLRTEVHELVIWHLNDCYICM